MIYYLLLLIGIFSFSCKSAFNAVVLANQCKKCEVIDLASGDIIFTNEGCGAQNTELYEKAAVVAYEKSRNGILCDLEVKCTTWKRSPEE